MKKVFLVFAIIIANGVFTSCTDLDENLENDPIKSELLATDGEEEQDPDEDDDDNDDGEITNGGN